MSAAVISDVIIEVRLELNDSSGTRFSSDECLAFIKKAARRASHIARLHDLQFAKKEAAFTATSTTTSFTLPSDFLSDVDLWNTATKKQLQKLTDREWNSVSSAVECSAWKIGNGSFSVMATPESDTALNLVYFYGDADNFRNLTYTSPVPYGDYLYDLLVEYTAIRMKNVDEMDFSIDAQLMQDFEAKILATAKSLSQNVVKKSKGWC